MEQLIAIVPAPPNMSWVYLDKNLGEQCREIVLLGYSTINHPAFNNDKRPHTRTWVSATYDLAFWESTLAHRNKPRSGGCYCGNNDCRTVLFQTSSHEIDRSALDARRSYLQRVEEKRTKQRDASRKSRERRLAKSSTKVSNDA
jgi:hypothetical protein